MRKAITVLLLALCGATACRSTGSHPQGASAVSAFATSPQVRHDEVTALQKLEGCAARQGLVFTVSTADPSHPVLHVSRVPFTVHPVRTVLEPACQV